MKQQVLTMLGLLCGAAWCSATEFEPPVRLKAGGVPIRVESIFPIQILPTLPATISEPSRNFWVMRMCR